jgi:hypothetical protein
MLNEDSPFLNINSKEFNVKIKHHQKCMLYKMMQLENSDYNFFLISSGTGSGKTITILVYLYYLKLLQNNGINIVVVPMNIFNQWKSEINKIYKKKILNIKFINDNIDILSLQNEENLKKFLLHDIVIISSDKYLLFCQYIDRTIIFNNLFIDEFDTIKHVLKYNLKSYKTWFVSATFKLNIDFTKNIINIENYNIQLDKLLQNEINCCQSFVKKCMHMKDYNYKKYIAKDFYIDNLLINLLSYDELTKINAHSFNIKECDGNKAESTKDILKNVYKYYHTLYYSKIETIEETEKKMKYTKSSDYNTYLSLKTQLEQEIHYYKNMISLLKQLCIKYSICVLCFDWIPNKKIDNDFLQKNIDYYKADCYNLICRDCVLEMIKNNNDIIDDKKIKFDCLNCNTFHTKKALTLNNIESINNDYYFYDKFKLLSDVLNICKDKTIIYSEYRGIDKKLTDITIEKNMDFIELNSGNISDIENVLNIFKNTSVQLLFISDINFGVGLNLEYVKNIIFFHKVKLDIKNQIIGRAQRYGRITTLNIYELNYANEYNLI